MTHELLPEQVHEIEIHRPQPTILTIQNGLKQRLVTVYEDGHVEFGEHYTPTEAVRIFWEAIGLAFLNEPCRKLLTVIAEAQGTSESAALEGALRAYANVVCKKAE